MTQPNTFLQGESQLQDALELVIRAARFQERIDQEGQHPRVSQTQYDAACAMVQGVRGKIIVVVPDEELNQNGESHNPDTG